MLLFIALMALVGSRSLVMADDCPSGSCDATQTCCNVPSISDEFSCCPLQNAVCCSDGLHCCPSDTVCNLSEGTCDRQNNRLTRLVSPKTTFSLSSQMALESAIRAKKVFCPGDEYYCPDDNTCCVLPSGRWGCCPIPSAVCCPDKLHCCPSGTHCGGGSRCIRGSRKFEALLKRPALPLK